MSAGKQYLIAVAASSFLVCLVEALPQKKSTKRVVSLCGGLFLLLALLRPVISLRFGDLSDYLSQFSADTAPISQALEAGEKETARLITAQTEEYILDKAAQLGARVTVSVTLSALSGSYQYPYSLTLCGRWTPEQRRALSMYISQTLGIPEERQLWNEDSS